MEIFFGKVPSVNENCGITVLGRESLFSFDSNTIVRDIQDPGYTQPGIFIESISSASSLYYCWLGKGIGTPFLLGGSVNRKRFDEYAQSFKGLMVRNCYNRRTKSDVLPLPFHKQPFSEQSKNIRSQNRTEDGENNSLRFLTLIMNQRCENPGKLIRRDLGLRSAYILDTAKDAPFLYLAIIIAVTRFYFFTKCPETVVSSRTLC